MRYRPLGESGLLVSVVGLGCNNFGGRLDTQGARAVVDAAIDAGVTLFDTSDTYGGGGGSETALGEILGRRRDQIVLATKFGHQHADRAMSPMTSWPRSTRLSRRPLPRSIRHPECSGLAGRGQPSATAVWYRAATFVLNMAE
jgi:aryl-alcohol dehydrogenase-like predicted oxidoreductase